MAITTLPYPNMDFVPLDVLTADELDQIVANIEAINSASIATGAIANSAITTLKIADSAITTAKIADDAITSDKIDWQTIELTDMSSSFVWDSGVSTASANDRLIKLYKVGNLVLLQAMACARSNYQWTTSWANIGTLPADCCPIYETTPVFIGNNRDSGQPLTGIGKLSIATSGLMRARASGTMSNAQLVIGGICWFVQ